jgi:hypothetical protein
MTTPTVIETRRNGTPVGERIELGRYNVPAGERVLYGFWRAQSSNRRLAASIMPASPSRSS